MLAQRHSPFAIHHSVFSLCLCAAVLLLTGCVGPRVTQPMRAIWVTRFDYQTPEDVTTIVNNCADAGFNAVVFQVRGNGTAFYKSRLEPWADELGGTDPGWDPLELACRTAHERGVELHAWVNVMPAWRGKTPPKNPEQLYNKHPDWFWYDQHGDRQALSNFYVSLNPCLPEVRDYIVAVFQEIVANYDLDGLHMDYIRFPSEPPAIPRGSGLDFPRDERTLTLFMGTTGKTPEEDPAAWNQWRTDCVTKLVADIHNMIRRTKPAVALTASVGAGRAESLRFFRDDRRWARERLIDAAFPMNYVDTPEEFGQRLEDWLAEKPPIPLVPGLWFGRHRGQSVEEATAAVKAQMDVAREKTGNFCLFSYGGLFDCADNNELARQTDEQRQMRQTRRDILRPYLRSLAAPAGH